MISLVEVKYINSVSVATITCGNCSEISCVNLPNTIKEEPYTYKCNCGSKITLKYNRRKFYRKKVTLFGMYSSMNGVDSGEITIHDISMSGVKIETSDLSSVNIGDIIKIDFILDNIKKSRISRSIEINSKEKKIITGEFCDGKTDKDLAFYMLP